MLSAVIQNPQASAEVVALGFRSLVIIVLTSSVATAIVTGAFGVWRDRLAADREREREDRLEDREHRARRRSTSLQIRLEAVRARRDEERSRRDSRHARLLTLESRVANLLDGVEMSIRQGTGVGPVVSDAVREEWLKTAPGRFNGLHEIFRRERIVLGQRVIDAERDLFETMNSVFTDIEMSLLPKDEGEKRGEFGSRALRALSGSFVPKRQALEEALRAELGWSEPPKTMS